MEKYLARHLETVASENVEVSVENEQALNDLDLVCIGGGIGDVIFA